LEILTIFAIIIAPVVAIQASKLLENRREKRRRRENVFKALMITRASRLNREHVIGLNSIDVEFYGKDKKSKEVVDAWKIYLDHLANNDFKDKALDAWLNKGTELLVSLLEKMAISLDYDFDKYSIKNTSYMPQYYGQLEDEQTILRESLVGLFLGKTSIPITVKQDESLDNIEEVKRAYAEIIKGTRAIKVIIEDKD